jgi:hypothetical protein
MSFLTANIWNSSFARKFILRGALLLFACRPALADQSVTLTWSPSPDTNAVGYKIYYGGASQAYTNTVALGNVTNVTVSGLTEGATYYFAATTVSAAGTESIFSNEATYAIPLSATNVVPGTGVPPSLAAIPSLTIYQNAGVQTVIVSNIDSGVQNGNLNLSVTATSSDATIIPSPVMSYTSGNTYGILTFAPAANAAGTATVTVTVNNGAGFNNLGSQSFTVTVLPVVNAGPTFDALTNLTIYQNAGAQTVVLTNINSGLMDGNVNVTVSADTSDATIIPAPTVNYTNGNNFGTLTFAPVPGALGTATVTVTIGNGNSSDNFVSQAFTVTVVPVPPATPPTLDAITNLVIYQNAGLQIVPLTGISSGSASPNLTISAISSNPALIPAPTVNYASPNNSGSLTFAPVANAVGTATVTVTADNGGASNNLVTQTFTVTVVANPAVNQSPTLDAIANVTLVQGAAENITLTGISSGSSAENQILRVTASSSNPALVPAPLIRYVNRASTATMTVRSSGLGVGTATITVTVNDGGRSNNIVRQSFTVTVQANQPPTLDAIADVTVAENSGVQTVTLTGITSGSPTENQNLRVSAVSSNPRLLSVPLVQYTSPANTAQLTFKPLPNRTGTATITVTVNDGGRNNNFVRQHFTVTVTAPSTNASPFHLSSGTNGVNPAATLSAATSAAGQFSFQVTGVVGGKYVVQASSDLAHWTSVETNTAPFIFQDKNASEYSHRFYRTYFVP